MASGQGHGSMSLSMKFIRLLIVLLNMAFFVIGAVLLALGIYVMKDPKLHQLRPLLNADIASQYSQSLYSIQSFSIVLIVIGGVLLLIGFVGCCGAIKGFRFLHLLYAAIVGIIILAEIALVILYVASQHRLKNEFVLKLQESIVKYYVGTPLNNSSSSNPISLSWDFTQFNLQCCGVISKNDYSKTTNWNRTNPYQPGAPLSVPFTCCPLNATKNWDGLPTNMIEANTCATTGINAYPQGCYARFIDLFNQYKIYIIIGGIVILAVEICAFLLAILLYCRKRDYDDV